MSGHVLVARLDNVGDVVLTGPAVRAVAAGATAVTFLCRPSSRAAAEMLPGVDRVLTFEAPWVPVDPAPLEPAAVRALVDQVCDLKPDVGIIFTSFHQSPLPLALLLRMAGVARLGAVSVDYPGSLLDVRHLVPDDVHEVERNLALAAAMGYRLPERGDARLAVRRDPGAVPPGLPDRPYVVVHPGATVPARTWSAAAYQELVARLVRRGWPVVVTGSAPERELCARVRGHTGAVDLAGRTGLPGLVEVLAGAAATVVGNTGPAHLAAAVGTPVVSLFAPTVPAVRWHPWGVDYVLLGRQDIACAGCRARTCPVAGHPCLGEIAVDDVAVAVERLAGRREAA